MFQILTKMMAVPRNCFVVLLLTTAGLDFGQTISTLQYSCNPSGAITVRNPDPSTFMNAIAALSATQQQCPILVTFMRTTFVIYNCPISHNITFILLKTNEPPEVLTGAMEYHTLRCQQIPATGVFRRVTDESWVTNEFLTTVAPSVTPGILLDMELKDMQTRVEKQLAFVGEVLRWEIEVYENYTVQPLNCTVYSGAGNDSLHLVENGCSLDTYLLGHFEYDSASSRHILLARLHAFHFTSSQRIIIQCKLLGCRDRYPNPSACDFTCPDKRRRRSSGQADEDILRNDGDYFDANVKTEIDVLEFQQSFYLKSGSKLPSSVMFTFVLCTIWSILVMLVQ